MKRSIVIAALILAAAFGAGRILDARLAAERALAARLTAWAGEKQIPGFPRRRPSEAARIAEAREAAAAYLNDPKGRKPVIVPSTEQANAAEIRISKLDAGQMEILLDQLLTAAEGDPEISVERLTNMLRDFAEKRPRAALDLIVKHAAILRRSTLLGELLSATIRAMALDDALGAIRWMKDHSQELPEAISHQTVWPLTNGLAQTSPRLALELTESLHLDESLTHDVLHVIISEARTNESRTAVLAALRECREGKIGGKIAASLVDQRIGDIGQELQRVPFETASVWLEGAGLTGKERDRIGSNLSRNYANQGGGEFQLWIEWMGRHATDEAGLKTKWPISDLMERWTRNDFAAAGSWLAEQPEGTTKENALFGYISEIAPHDLETALLWVDTVPDEARRAQLYQTIHNNLPRKTDAEKQAAEGFANEHRLK